MANEGEGVGVSTRGLGRGLANIVQGLVQHTPEIRSGPERIRFPDIGLEFVGEASSC